MDIEKLDGACPFSGARWRLIDMMSGVERASDRTSDLWTQHSAELVRFATLLVGPSDAPDVVSIAFSKLARMNTAQISNPRAYLFRVVHTTALDEARRQQRRHARDLYAMTPATMTQDSADVDVRNAIVRLPPRQRSIVYFFYWEDLDAAQIGELLGVATKTVRRQLAKAQFRLRKELQ